MSMLFYPEFRNLSGRNVGFKVCVRVPPKVKDVWRSLEETGRGGGRRGPGGGRRVGEGSGEGVSVWGHSATLSSSERDGAVPDASTRRHVGLWGGGGGGGRGVLMPPVDCNKWQRRMSLSLVFPHVTCRF